MKTMIRPQELKALAPRRSNWAEPALQLFINLAGIYVANEISIYVWRAVTGC